MTYPQPLPNAKFKHAHAQFLLMLQTLPDPCDRMGYRSASLEREYQAPPTTDMEELTEPPEIEVGDMIAAERFERALRDLRPEYRRVVRYHYVARAGNLTAMDWDELIVYESRNIRLDANYYAITLREATRAVEDML